MDFVLRRTTCMQTNLTFEGSQDYVAGADLMSAVNISMALQKPLLIKG